MTWIQILDTTSTNSDSFSSEDIIILRIESAGNRTFKLQSKRSGQPDNNFEDEKKLDTTEGATFFHTPLSDTEYRVNASERGSRIFRKDSQ